MPTTPTTLANRTYAQALLNLAEETGQLDSVAEELAQLATLYAQQPDLRRLMGSPLISAAERRGIVERTFKGRVSDLLYRFLQVLARKGRLGELPGVAAAFAALVKEKRGVIEADVYVAAPLEEAVRARVAEAMGAALGKTVQVQQHVDESLIGGLRVRIGDQLIDASVATQLRLIREKLIARGREKARAAIQAMP